MERRRGLLMNLGLSIVSRADGSTHALLRDANALPLSEFRLADDMTVYGLPDEALLTFEGSGVETVWTLEFSAAANRFSLDHVADVHLTLDIRASYSPQLHVEQLAQMPTSVRRLALFSALSVAGDAVAELDYPGKPSVAVDFDLPAAGRLSRFESNRKIKNVVLMLPGGEPIAFTGAFGPIAGPVVQVPFTNGMAFRTPNRWSTRPRRRQRR